VGGGVEQGLEAAGFTVVTKDWLDRYDEAVESARKAYFADFAATVQKEGQKAFMQLFTNPFMEPAIIPVTEEDAGAETDTAIYVIARNSGEGKDRRPVEGEYDLFQVEKDAIHLLGEKYEKLIVVLNVGSVIDTKFLRGEEGIDAILLMSQAGNIGGYALADVVTGKVSPSGKLTTTWAENYLDYPGAEKFSHMNGDIDDEYYTEGIYVGYRYFDTFDVAPAYPFGYGGSYTNFTVETKNVEADGNAVTVKVKVTNSGSTYAGKEVVQVYYSAPAGKLAKPYQELAAYKKTKELAPGESQELVVSYPVKAMASYDEERAVWVLEAGTYYVRVGTSSRDTAVAAALALDGEAVTEKLSNRLPLDCEMQELSAEGVACYSYEGEAAQKESAPVISICAADIPCVTAVYRKVEETAPEKKTEQKITMDDVKAGRYTLDELEGQLTVREMAELCVGTARGGFGSDSVIGAASAACPGAAGDTTSLMLEDRNVRNMILADGPAGLRLSTHFVADGDGNLIPGAGAAPMPGRASSSSALALLRSMSAPLAAFGDPATGALGAAGFAGATGAAVVGAWGACARAGAATRLDRRARRARVLVEEAMAFSREARPAPRCRRVRTAPPRLNPRLTVVVRHP